MGSVLIIVSSLLAGVALARARRSRVEASWRELASAVPDMGAISGTPYRQGEGESETALALGSRKRLELLPRSERLLKVQGIAAAATAPIAAGIFVAWPLMAAPWSALIGAAWGLGLADGLLTDDRRRLGFLALLLLPASFFAVWGAAAGLVLYGAVRTVLDLKGSAAGDEADRERLADPRFLVASKERRAAGIARNRRPAGSSPSAGGNSAGPAATK